jgi:isopentenyldiphosphate isomerase
MNEENLYHVDENDVEIGKVLKSEIRKNKLLSRSSIVLVFNPKGEILVHKRAETKDLFPDYYDMFIGGGVTYGESYDEAAIRETKEEIGAAKVQLVFLFKYKYDQGDNKSFFQVYKSVYSGAINFQKEEIESGEFVSIEELQKMIKEEKFCTDSVEMFEKYLKEYYGKSNKDSTATWLWRA